MLINILDPLGYSLKSRTFQEFTVQSKTMNFLKSKPFKSRTKKNRFILKSSGVTSKRGPRADL